MSDIRTAALDDIPAMHAVRCAVRENVPSDVTRITLQSYRRHIDSGDAWVAAMAGGIVGFAALDADDGGVWALFVHPDAEGRGIGRALLDMVVARARAHGIGGLWLTTARGSRAEKVYAKAGWTRVGATDAETRWERPLR